jgi:hypothetical protein
MGGPSPERGPLFQTLIVTMPDCTPLGAMGVTLSTPLVAMDLSLIAARPAALHPNRHLNDVPRGGRQPDYA